MSEAREGTLPAEAVEPPEVPPAELPAEALRALVDAGDLEAVAQALREQNVRLPAVLAELDRVLEGGLGNLAAALATLLIDGFRVARAPELVERALAHRETAGAAELADLAAALLGRERLGLARRVVDAALARDPGEPKALYLSARLDARRGDPARAFEQIARLSPELLGAPGLAAQARYAAFTGRAQAARGALRQARRLAREDEGGHLEHAEALLGRLELAGVELGGPAPADATPRPPVGLRAALALEYGSVLVALAQDPTDGGRFGMEALDEGSAGQLIRRIAASIRALGLPIASLLFADEDGEVVAAALAASTGAPAQRWRPDQQVEDGAWLCLASASAHPHLERRAVLALQEALDAGTLRTLALLLPCGWRGPLVPDVVGRIGGDDELGWSRDEEVDEVVERLLAPGASSSAARDDDEALARHLERFGGLFRAAQPLPRPRHVPYLDETPVPRAP